VYSIPVALKKAYPDFTLEKNKNQQGCLSVATVIIVSKHLQIPVLGAVCQIPVQQISQFRLMNLGEMSYKSLGEKVIDEFYNGTQDFGDHLVHGVRK